MKVYLDDGRTTPEGWHRVYWPDEAIALLKTGTVTFANTSIPERIVTSWLGHSDSERVRHFYHLADEEALREMENLDLVGKDAGRSGVEEVRNPDSIVGFGPATGGPAVV
ncbi:hypothetical protein SAMN06265222_10785 [Neorhodopirellula lusitana]|uniref:Cyclic-phosphate processing Receiver domain-containing protein n=1 Tax=Neorhodopirellula lusitana TaxID=445327 RepID=A0ABY1Q6L8_9BACT|nr:cyclic-phosphate processing receiver domain-containing protein [Neorhodopirellula lusitana]SMP61364.1 hypothetical protein SAMN06265222_10785 [Neorhodopirellula lusitana]